MKSKNKKICLVVLTAILVISAFSVIPTTVGAQPVEVWNVTWPGLGTAVATTEDSVYLAGVNTNLTDAFLNKYDKDGNLIWNITCGGIGTSGLATATSGDNAVYLAGSKTNESVAPIYTNDSDAFLVKFSEPTPSPTPTPPGFEA